MHRISEDIDEFPVALLHPADTLDECLPAPPPAAAASAVLLSRGVADVSIVSKSSLPRLVLLRFIPPPRYLLTSILTIPESTAITAMILSPGIATNAFTAILDGGSSFCIIVCACLFLPSFAGGGSSNSVPILAAEGSSCYAPTVTSVNGHQELNNLMPIELSNICPDDLFDLVNISSRSGFLQPEAIKVNPQKCEYSILPSSLIQPAAQRIGTMMTSTQRNCTNECSPLLNS
ncbi:hypothetical protein Aperf_G00000016818 [Anoplocephala perfoliata]